MLRKLVVPRKGVSFWRRVATLATGLGLLIGSTVALAPSASAYEVTDQFRNLESGRCVLEVGFITDSCRNTLWTLYGPVASSDGHDVFMLRNQSGFCLTHLGGDLVSNASPCNAQKVDHQWEVIGQPTQSMKLKPPSWAPGHHLCLDDSRDGQDNNIHMETCAGTVFQEWKIGY